MIRVIGPGDRRAFQNVIDVTSHSEKWKALSPFLLGPVKLYGNHTAYKMENAWQYCKVYAKHIGDDGNPSHDYFKWALEGWNSDYANRYPMGKNAKPEYSYWDGEKLSYIEARKKIYIPIYSKAVRNTIEFKILESMVEFGKDITLFDFDGYDNTKFNMSINDVVNSKNKKMGHAFVLKMMLEGVI